jgi:spermidine dehydrogenase
MKRQPIDGNLGEDRAIPRRDFLQGVLVGAATALTGPLLQAHAAEAALPGGSEAAGGAGAGASGAQGLPGYYPPLLNGMRGSHPGAFENAHALRDGHQPEAGTETGESYDLIVVGGGISGLSAAYFYRAQTSRSARILVLDNHDDFGGHAKRNEFQIGGRALLLNGGTMLIDSPRPYDATAAGLIKELGINVAALKKLEHDSFYSDHGLQRGLFFDKETFGADKLVVGAGVIPAAKLLADAPLSEQARQDYVRLNEGAVDYMPGLTSDQKKHRLAKMSYRDFLRDVAKVDPAILEFYQPMSHGEWAVGIDALSALDVWAFDFPGFKGMKLEPGVIPEMGYTPSGYASTGGSPTFHFPDGNATIARLLVRSLVPGAIPGSTAEDVVTARCDYSRLDRPEAAIRIRLNSTAVRAVNVGGDPATAREVAVTYIRDGKTYNVRARNCVLAGYNAMVPYLCPELPEKQKAALHGAVKSPLVYTSVALRNWQSFKKLGVHDVYAPGSYFSSFGLNNHVNIGDYRSPSSADEPILMRMTRVPAHPGLTEHEQNKVGRAELLGTTFATFERNIREQLARTLGGGGFDPARDIEAITVNRWPHGYAAEFNPLFEPVLPPEQQRQVIARARFGRIAIANSDAGAAAYTDSAIDQAHRAVGELLRG